MEWLTLQMLCSASDLWKRAEAKAWSGGGGEKEEGGTIIGSFG